MVVLVVVAVGTATMSGVAGSQPGGDSMTDAQYEQTFRQIAGPAGQEFIDGLVGIEKQVGIDPGDNKLTKREVGETSHDSIIEALARLADLLKESSFVAGVGFALAAILKFHQHKDDPTRAPVSQTVMLLFIAAALIFLPSLFPVAGPPNSGSNGDTVLADIKPLLQDAKQAVQGNGSELPADSAERLQQSLSRRGVTGEALDAAVQLELLAAGVAIANARFSPA